MRGGCLNLATEDIEMNPEEKKRHSIQRLIQDLLQAKSSGKPERMTRKLWIARGKILFEKLANRKGVRPSEFTPDKT